MKAVRELRLVMTLLATLGPFPAATQVLPGPPQSSGANDGTDGPGFIRVPSSTKGGTGGYIDVAGYQSCRYVTTTVANDNTKNGEVIPVGLPGTWQGYLGASIPGETQTVCCRPAPPPDSFCSSGTVISVGNVAGTDTTGYGKAGTSGTATAQCKDADGTYTETHTYSCAISGSGVTADGVWQFTVDDGDSCTSPSTTTYGACSTAGVGGWGNQLVTLTDCLGRKTSLGYTGPACYTPPPCTTNYQASCSGSTEILTDYGSCHNPTQTIPNGCHLESYPCSASCSPTDQDPFFNVFTGCTTIYSDCYLQGNWGPPPGSSGCTPGYELAPYQTYGCNDPSMDRGGLRPVLYMYIDCTCGNWVP